MCNSILSYQAPEETHEDYDMPSSYEILLGQGGGVTSPGSTHILFPTQSPPYQVLAGD